MRHLRQKMENNRGETLIEVLASILITALSVALLFTCVMASTKIDGAAKEKDSKHYDALSGVEVYSVAPDTTPIPGTVTITRVTDPGAGVDPGPTPGEEASAAPSVQIYGDEDGGMYSYKRN